MDYYYKKYEGTPVDAINHAMVRIRGSYALALMFKDYPEEIFAARKDSPMILGTENGESYIASDVPAILKYTRNVYYIGNMEMARVKKGEITFYNLDGEEIEKQSRVIEWDAEAAEKAGYEHFMMKEIHEQPKAVEDTLNSVLQDGSLNLEEMGFTEEIINNISCIYIVACGSAWHVGMTAQYVIEDMAGIPVRVEVASEFRYRKPLLDTKRPGDHYQPVRRDSGQLGGPSRGKGKRRAYSGCCKCSRLLHCARSRQCVLHPGRTGNFSCHNKGLQHTAYGSPIFWQFSLPLQKNILQKNSTKIISRSLKQFPEKIKRILEDKERLQWFAAKQVNARDVFFIGRGIDYAVSLEGSLKMKEISYIHSEAYPAGELKHGTISLIENGTLVIGVLTQPELFEKTVSNMVECKSRGAYLMGLTGFGNYNIEDTVDFTVYIPGTDPHFTASLAVVPLQLLGYYVSVARGLDVDKPRNLAKSVTVE